MKSHRFNDPPSSLWKIFVSSWKSLIILSIGVILTIAGTLIIENSVIQDAQQDFQLNCTDIQSKILSRLHSYAQLLRSGSALFAASDTITRSQWETFYEVCKINRNLPGIQGFGVSIIIPKKEYQKHIQQIRTEGFKNYSIHPSGDREFYTSIIYLEPFSGRNLRAFGYDMFTEPTRRKAMELSRDSDIAVLSGKVRLVQETDKDLQPGVLMYVPVYRKGMPANTLEQRRINIIGWVYSPYRMNDLMVGILGRWNIFGQKRIHLQIYDDTRSANSLLFDSQKNDTSKVIGKSSLVYTSTVKFKGLSWILSYSQISKNYPLFQGKVLVVFIGGLLVSLLSFFLSLSFFRMQSSTLIIKKTNSKLSFTISELEQMAFITNHDLQEPIRTLTQFTQLLHDDYSGKLDEEGNKYLDFIHNASVRMSNMFRDMFEYTLLGKESIKTNVDCHKIVDEALHDLTDVIKGSNSKITVQKLPAVNGFETELRLLFQNLIENAIKYQKPDNVPCLLYTSPSPRD